MISRQSSASVLTDTSVQLWPIERLIPYARNPRKNDAAVDRMAASSREFGFKIPVLARSDGLVVDGHLRLKAAKKLGINEVPVILISRDFVGYFRLSLDGKKIAADVFDSNSGSSHV